MKGIRLLKFITIISTVVLIGCDVSSDGSNADTAIGSFEIQITDAPLDFSNINEINITIEDIAARSAQNGEFILLQDEPVNLNIMNFRNGESLRIARNDRTPVGLFDQLQLEITDVTIELKNSNENIEVGIPSQARNGYTINFDPNVEILGGVINTILLDLDLYQSFTQEGVGDTFFPSFNFNPVIRYAQLRNSGSIAGEVLGNGSVVITNALVKLHSNSQLISTTFTENSGEFGFIGIEPGTYLITAEKEGLQSDTIETQVEVQSESNISFQLDSTSTSN